MARPKSKAMCALMGAFLGALIANGATIYVSTTGNDETGDGSDGNPYATAAKALTKMTQNPDTIYFASGTYYFTEPAVICNKDVKIVGKDDRSVIFDGQNQTRIFGVDALRVDIGISGITFRNARATMDDGSANWNSYGGAVRLVPVGGGFTTSSTITNCAFENCSSDLGGGGAVYVGGGSTVVDCTFTGCTGGLAGRGNGPFSYGNNPGGAAIYANTGTGDVTVRLCSFTDNVCSNGVGVIGSGFCDGSAKTPNTNAWSVVVSNCGFTNNVSYGFAACLGLKARTVENCSFKGNVAKSAAALSGYQMNCGGVWATEREVALGCGLTNVFRNCIFEDNVSEGTAGGGVFRTTGATFVVVTNCVIAGNSSAAYGNVYYGTPNADGGLIMEDCVVTGNWSRATGTSIYNRYGTINQGEGANYRNATLRLRRCLFAGNIDHGSAGTVWSPAIGTEIVDCEFRGNWTRNCGSAPATVVFTSTATNALVRGCLFAANTNNATRGSIVRFANYNFQGTPAGTGTGSTVESCTFVGNRSTGTADSYTGAICLFDDAAEGFAIRNCVFCDNRSTNANAPVKSFAAVKSDATKKAATFCWEDGAQLIVTEENGNIKGSNPAFADAAAGDYSLAKASPCRNAGVNQSWMTGAKDIAGNVRIWEHDGVGVVDMGCYEWINPFWRAPTVISVK